MKPMRWSTLAIAFLFVIGVASGVSARTSAADSTKDFFSAKGTIQSVDPESGTITVRVEKASKLLEDKKGSLVTFHTGKETVVKTCGMFESGQGMVSCGAGENPHDMGHGNRKAQESTEPEGTRLNLSEIKPGTPVHVVGHFDPGKKEFEARDVMVPPA